MSDVPTRLTSILSTHPDVICLVLRDLCERDLKSCALVCKTWRTQVIALRKYRTTLQCLTSQSDGDSDEVFKDLLGYRVPCFCLSFVKYSLYNRIALVGTRKFKNSVVHKFLNDALSENCQSVLLTCMKFPDDNNDVSIITFPERKGVRIQQFQVRSYQTQVDVLTNITNLKCVLALMYSCAFMLSNFVVEDGKHEHDFLSLVTFSGVNIEASSVFIPQEALSTLQVHSHMTHLDVGSESITLMFSERQRNVDDISVLRSLHPGAQIAGLDTEDVFTMVEDRLVSTIPSWQGVPESIRDCYTRTSGPAQVISLSYRKDRTRH